MSNLVLVPLVKSVERIQPAAMFEKEAARYCKIGLTDFRKLVNAGKIIARTHVGRTRRIFLRFDLDAYLDKLPIEEVSA
jgi:hypothetical protein